MELSREKTKKHFRRILKANPNIKLYEMYSLFWEQKVEKARSKARNARLRLREARKQERAYRAKLAETKMIDNRMVPNVLVKDLGTKYNSKASLQGTAKVPNIS